MCMCLYIYIYFFNHVPTLFPHASLAGTKSAGCHLFFVSNQSCSKNHPPPRLQSGRGRDCLGWVVVLSLFLKRNHLHCLSFEAKNVFMAFLMWFL